MRYQLVPTVGDDQFGPLVRAVPADLSAESHLKHCLHQQPGKRVAPQVLRSGASASPSTVGHQDRPWGLGLGSASQES